MSAITKVKVCSPEISNIARGQGFRLLEASNATSINGEHVATRRGQSPWQAIELFIAELGRTMLLPRKEESF